MTNGRIERRASEHAGGKKEVMGIKHGTARQGERKMPVNRRAGVLHKPAYGRPWGNVEAIKPAAGRLPQMRVCQI